jgi:hypothetical protein
MTANPITLNQRSPLTRLGAIACICTAALFGVTHASEIGREFADADAALNTAYKDALASLTDPAQKAFLVRAQSAWLKFRDENIALFAARYPQSKGGLFLNIQMTVERTKYLAAFATASPTSDPTGEVPSGYPYAATRRESNAGTSLPATVRSRSSPQPTVNSAGSSPSPAGVATFVYSNFDQAFHANQPAFMRQYGNKLIQIRAIALRFEGDGVLLVGGSVGWNTTCYFDQSQIPKLDKIKGGDHVTVVGRLGESSNTAVLRSCQLAAVRPADGASDEY